MADMRLDAAKIRRLIYLYHKAKEGKLKSFRFEGTEFVTDYAYYFLKVFAPKFGVPFNE